MTTAKTDWNAALERARLHAPFLARSLDRRPELAELLAQGRGEEALAAAKASGTGQVEGVALRRERLGLALVLAIGDLAGAFDLETVTGELSAFADDALGRAIRAAIARRVEGADDTGFYALALGKHGARELNYSSDIDPILLYDPQAMARRERDEPGEAAQRYAREIVQLLSENTAEGYVFRVDLRLRPASEVSPLAISEGAALTHYESSALPWERAAFLRARASSGDIAAGKEFLAAIDPFIWRRSLDFGAIAEIGALTARIRDAHDGPEVPGPGFNVKLGRGGIREIEFFVQTQQLIHGGRNPSLRQRGLFAALDALVEAALVTRGDADILAAAYRRLRTVEHRLQMVDDRQTHSLPEGDALENVAALDGLDGAAALVADLETHTSKASALFDRVLDQVGGGGSTAPLSPYEALAKADALPANERKRIKSRIEGWLDGRYRTLRSPKAQEAFRSLLPALLDAIGDVPEPDQALLRWEKLLATMPSAINLFRLLEARPGLVNQLLRILSLAPPLADTLARSPTLLDALIDKTALDLPGDVASLELTMRPVVQDPDYERSLDRLRIVTGEQQFALGVQLIENAHDPLDIAAGLSRVAEAAVQRSLGMAEADFAVRHGRIEGSDLVVIGLGRLGGEALTNASDLDLVNVFTGDFANESDGEKTLGGTLYFNRLAQRVGAALSVPTAQGALYEVDTRLRPQGAQGPLAVSLDSFARYQRQDAWIWEHMALTRARVVAGPPKARRAVEAELEAILRLERDPAEVRDAVLKMRSEMAQHKPAKGVLDAKLLRGGLVDLEFLIHHQQLTTRVGLKPQLGAAIAALEAENLLPDGFARAHDFLTRLIVAMRLLAPDAALPQGVRADVLCGAVCVQSPSDLLQTLRISRQCVAQGWAQFLDTRLEID